MHQNISTAEVVTDLLCLCMCCVVLFLQFPSPVSSSDRPEIWYSTFSRKIDLVYQQDVNNEKRQTITVTSNYMTVHEIEIEN